MPYLRIETNVPAEKIPDDFVLKATKIIATSLSKPENYCSVAIIPNVNMAFGGSKEPCAQASLMSIGQLGVEPNKKHSAAIFKFVKESIGVPSNRMYISFINAPTSDVGYNGTTFHEIFG